VGLIDLLPKLYGVVLIPDAVADEYRAGMRDADPELSDLDWLRIVPSVDHELALPSGLGAGEVATLSLALHERARAVLLDERLARRVAAQLQLPVVGTIGVLLAAKQAGYIMRVRVALDRMVEQGRRISPTLRAAVLKAAGEHP
jgi:uncharacterized protein